MLQTTAEYDRGWGYGILRERLRGMTRDLTTKLGQKLAPYLNSCPQFPQYLSATVIPPSSCPRTWYTALSPGPIGPAHKGT